MFYYYCSNYYQLLAIPRIFDTRTRLLGLFLVKHFGIFSALQFRTFFDFLLFSYSSVIDKSFVDETRILDTFYKPGFCDDFFLSHNMYAYINGIYIQCKLKYRKILTRRNPSSERLL